MQYVIHEGEKTVHPSVLPNIDINALSGAIGNNVHTQVVTNAVDLRWHFKVVFEKEVKTTDFVHFKYVVKSIWEAKGTFTILLEVLK